MKRGTALAKKAARPRWWRTVAVLCIISLSLAGAFFITKEPDTPDTKTTTTVPGTTAQDLPLKIDNPLSGRQLYNDASRAVVALANEYARNGDSESANLVQKVSNQPGVTWLNGPHDSDTAANGDVRTVTRTSAEAAASNSVPVYQLYAIPKRDACAGYSAGGFSSNEAYLTWLDKIIDALSSDAVFLIETDSIAQTIRTNCLTASELASRYALLDAITTRLSQSPKVLASYLDAGHSEWFPDPTVLVDPLTKSGIAKVRGVSVNVANFIATTEITAWSKQLTELLGGNKSVVIDTSRNGQGAPPASVTGTARWCNPAGVGLGPIPSTAITDSHVDAYLWVKNIGESDGDCFGNPKAGVLSRSLLRDIAAKAAY